MCVESISFVGKYVPIDTGTETRRCRNTQKVLHNVKLISPRLFNVLTKLYSGTFLTLIGNILMEFLVSLFFLTVPSQNGKHYHGFKRNS